jgi:hypothetical protein
MEKYGLSLKELEGQNVELLPDRIEMRNRRRRRRHGGGFDCDAAQVNSGVANIPLLISGNNTAAVCFSQ